MNRKLKRNQLYLFLIIVFIVIVSCNKQTTYVEVAPIVEHQQFSLSENSPVGTLVGTISVENTQDRSLTFHLVKTENSDAFYINKVSGLIQLLDSSLIDYETIQQVELEIMIAYRTGSNDYAIFPKVIIEIIDEIESYEIVLNSSTGNSFDGMVSSLNNDKNYANNEILYVSTWTNDLVTDIRRSFIYFDLSVLPSNIDITNALLWLYNPNDGISEHEHSQLTGSNEIVIAPISSDWKRETLNWNNQPSYSLKNSIEINSTINGTQNIQVNVTNLINEEYQNQADYFGMILRLKNEVFYRRVCFASMENDQVDLRPKLKIAYLK